MRKAAFTLSVALLLATPCVPYVYRWLHPYKLAAPVPGVDGAISFGFGVLLGAIGEGITIMVYMAAVALAGVIMSLIALAAAWIGHESNGMKWLSASPVLFVAGVWIIAALI